MPRRVAWLGAGTAVGLLVTAALVAASAQARTSASLCQTDGSVSVKVCLRQIASFDYAVGTQEQIDVTHYRVRVWNLDHHNAVLNNVTVRATAYGRCTSGCGHYQPGVVKRHTFRHIRSGDSHSMRVPWHAATIVVDDAGDGFQAANAYVVWHYRGNRKVFQTDNVCAGTIAGPASCNY